MADYDLSLFFNRMILIVEDARQGVGEHCDGLLEGKPEPEIYLKALAALNASGGNGKPIEAADCLVIEDSKGGIRGARRASRKCLAVTNSHPAELLNEATAVVKRLENVNLNFLQNMCP